MSNALRDQLLKSGLVNDKQLKKASKEQRKEQKQQQGKPATTFVDQVKHDAQQGLQEKAERDRQLNLQRKEAAEHKALAAQNRQLIEAHRIELSEGEIPFNFPDGSKVKRIYVTEKTRLSLSLGRIAIARLDGRYELIPADVAEKIRQRQGTDLAFWSDPAPSQTGPATDDPYAQYQVPDDLIW